MIAFINAAVRARRFADPNTRRFKRLLLGLGRSRGARDDRAPRGPIVLPSGAVKPAT